jgi:hypothetical protein
MINQSPCLVLVSYYAAYVAFFKQSIDKKGVNATLEDYIFSKKFNFIEGRDTSTQPMMLIRFLVDLLHPPIHVGYGTEFGIPGMITEGEPYTTLPYAEA